MPSDGPSAKAATICSTSTGPGRSRNARRTCWRTVVSRAARRVVHLASSAGSLSSAAVLISSAMRLLHRGWAPIRSNNPGVTINSVVTTGSRPFFRGEGARNEHYLRLPGDRSVVRADGLQGGDDSILRAGGSPTRPRAKFRGLPTLRPGPPQAADVYPPRSRARLLHRRSPEAPHPRDR